MQFSCKLCQKSLPVGVFFLDKISGMINVSLKTIRGANIRGIKIILFHIIPL